MEFDTLGGRFIYFAQQASQKHERTIGDRTWVLVVGLDHLLNVTVESR
jgi:hypothetical protein